MTKLSDTQSIILSAAAQRADGNVLPLPGSLRGGAAIKVVGALLARGLSASTSSTARASGRGAEHDLAQPRAGRPRRPPPHHRRRRSTPSASSPRRCPTRFNEGTNSAGEPAAARPRAPTTAPVEAPPKRRGRPRKAAPTARDTAAPRKTRDDTKQAQLIAMLRRKEGATIAQIVAATGWQPHYADVRIMPR